jgi:uncharacterized protein UPF0236
MWYTTFGCLQLEEQVLRLGRRGAQLRPFCLSAGVQNRGYSQRLQRVMVDFGAEHSFAKAAERIQEHYGIEVPVEVIRQHTLYHGRRINQIPAVENDCAAQTLIVQMDGTMIPVMQPGDGPDARKDKELFWREARLCLARSQDKAQAVYGTTLGTAETAGWVWREVAVAAGLTDKTQVHGLGDGAPWIVDKFQDNFGPQGSYLLDFYHVSEYLAQAAPQVVAKGKERQWIGRQQARLLKNQSHKVLKSLQPHIEPAELQEAPVSAAYRYLTERRDCLDYASAQARHLPIGSGEVESGHRHVIQKRLKVAGAWWKETNAHSMLNLRTARANHLWKHYWNSLN